MTLFKAKKRMLAMGLVIGMLGLVGCGGSNTPDAGAGGAGSEAPQTEVALSGEIKIDGSSTVVPITEAVAEEFNAEHPGVKIPVGVSGTGGGFKKFVVKETDISNASRPIKDSEAEDAKANGVEYVELKVAFDGISVVINPQNTWAETLTVDELKKMWAPDSTVKTWKDIRAEWPAEEIKFYAPGTDSGTFDYFTEEINGKTGAIRPDITPSEDDNVLVQGVAGDKNAIGFFGFAYYEENQDKLKVVKVDNGQGPIAPTFDTIKDGSYAPLSRPLFIYVNKESLKKPEVKEFTTFYLTVAKDLVKEVGYVALPDELYTEGLNQIK